VGNSYWQWGYKDGYRGNGMNLALPLKDSYKEGWEKGFKDRKSGLPSIFGNGRPLVQKGLF